MYDLNDKTVAVRNIQHRLMTLGYYKEKLNGRYDSITKSAVEDFQAAESIVITGVVDYPTFNALNSRYQSLKGLSNNRGFPIMKESNCIFVREINGILRRILEYYYGAYDLEISTYYSDKTQNAVDELRNIFDLGYHEGIDEEFYNRLLMEDESIRRSDLNV